MNHRLREINYIMQENKLSEESDLMIWYRRLFTRFGIWPKGNNELRFILSLVWNLIQIATEYADLLYHVRDLEGIVLNLTESNTCMMTSIKLVVLHKNRKLGEIIDVMNEDYANNKLKTSEEQKQCEVYDSLAQLLTRILRGFVLSTSAAYCVRPFGEYIFTRTNNETMPYTLPYRTRQFYDITNVYTYSLTYAFQAGAFYINGYCHVASDGLIIMITMHMCGQLSALTKTIKNLKKETNDDHKLKIGDIINQHRRITWMVEQMNEEFGLVFLVELFDFVSLICLTGFNVITNSDITKPATLVNFIVYEAAMLTLLYAYCFVGERLIEESRHLRNAFYQCDWYEMSPSQSKDIIICMVGSDKPLCLTAGKICVFSLELFTQVVKTAVGYISVLETLM